MGFFSLPLTLRSYCHTVRLIAPVGSLCGGQTPRACSACAAGTLRRPVGGGAGRRAAKTAWRKLSACAGRLLHTACLGPPWRVARRCVTGGSAAPPLLPLLRASPLLRAPLMLAAVSPDLAGARVAPRRPGLLLAVLRVHLLGVWPLGVTLGVAAARWTHRVQAPHHSRRAPLSLQMWCTHPPGTSGRGRLEEGGRPSVCSAASPKPPVWGMTWWPGRALGRAG